MDRIIIDLSLTTDFTFTAPSTEGVQRLTAVGASEQENTDTLLGFWPDAVVKTAVSRRSDFLTA